MEMLGKSQEPWLPVRTLSPGEKRMPRGKRMRERRLEEFASTLEKPKELETF